MAGRVSGRDGLAAALHVRLRAQAASLRMTRTRDVPPPTAATVEARGGASTVSRVAIVTDSVSDMPPEVAAAAGITVVPLVVSFGSESFRPNVNLTTDEFWARMTAPDAPFPTTAAASPGDFLAGFDAAFDGGADASSASRVGRPVRRRSRRPRSRATCCRTARSTSSTRGRRRWATGCWPRWAPSWRRRAGRAAEIAAVLEERKADIDLYVALDTLEYLKRGGRISGARAAVGTMLSIKPIITVIDGVVENADRVRSRAKARERVLELRPRSRLERATILHTTKADVEEFRTQFPGALRPRRRGSRR